MTRTINIFYGSYYHSMKRFLPLFLLVFSLQSALGQAQPLKAADSVVQMRWVDNVYQDMSLEERIGQLFMVIGTSKGTKDEVERITGFIEEYHIGGVIFSVGGPVRQAQLTNQYQEKSKWPLLIGMDAEWGLAMRLDSTFAFPWNTTLGAIQDTLLIEKIGRRIGEQCKRLGVHINFTPVLDINTNPDNPIIGRRSFGEQPENVAQKGRAIIRGLSQAGILGTGKHFPGHGDTSDDSHKVLPVIAHDRSRLDSVELMPYRSVIKQGIPGVMVAHLDVPALETQSLKPSSLSARVIRNLLRNQMDFEGLVLTDALNMNGVSNYGEPGEAELMALKAGNDILLMPKSLPKAFELIKKEIQRGRISKERLEGSVKKILMAKYKAGLADLKPVATENLVEELNTVDDVLLYEEAMEKAITLVKDPLNLVPLKNLENKRIAYIGLGDAPKSEFISTLNQYAVVEHITGTNLQEVKEQLKSFNLILIGFHKSDESPWKSFELNEQEKRWLTEISALRNANTVLTVFTSPYALQDITSFNTIDGILMAYQNSAIAQESAAEVLFGALPATGKLPVSAHVQFPAGTGKHVSAIKRLGYSIPERVGLSSIKLARVDSLVRDGLDSLMFPGAQVLVARKGKVVYHKGFGTTTYNNGDPITTDHIYDLASLTKILATLPIIMSMEEQGDIALNTTFKELIPEYADTELKDVTVLKALSHYGRLPAWIAFYMATLNKNRRPSNDFYRNRPVDGFSIKVTDKMYLTDAYKDSIYNRIGRQELKSNRYRYSDVAYYVLKKYIEETYNNTLDQIARQFLYKRLGTTHTAYNPLEIFPASKIVPSEVDNYFRYQVVRGFVHDMGAAMQGGVGGHAGLFSNANDVAKIMQMYLQGGYYGGVRFLDSRTVEKFNKCYFCHKKVRRGVGFDKPQLEDKGPTCGCVSRKSFGHSGFTGTYTWADPEEEIVYVFLSNRTYPSSRNTLLVRSGLRTRIQQAIYDSIID